MIGGCVVKYKTDRNGKVMDMKKRIEIKQIKQLNDSLILYVDEEDHPLENAVPKQHMLVDSDQLAFIYLLEQENDYVYVSLPSMIWPVIKEAMDQDKHIVLMAGRHEIELAGMKEELEYLIHNIEGNANYGEELVKRVEEIFLLKK
jgi:Family of unknown function (UPF0738)